MEKKMVRKRDGNDELRKTLIVQYGDDFARLHRAGLPVSKIMTRLNLTKWNAYILYNALDLPKEKWQAIGMPEKFSEETIGLLYGTLLGDGSIHIPGWGKNKSFTTSHSPKQKEYLEHKRNLLHILKPYEIRNSKDKWGTLVMRTAPHPEFNIIFDNLYSNGTKQVSMSVLNKLTPEGIALWFMDDGTLKKGGLSIATCSFDEKSIYNIVRYFDEKYDILASATINNDYWRVSFYGKNALKFKAMIEPYIIPSMRYKIDLIPGTGNGAERWLKEDDELLRKEFVSFTEKDLLIVSDIVKRSVSAIRNRAWKLHLPVNIKKKSKTVHEIKLTQKLANSIRNEIKAGSSIKDIANKYSVSVGTIYLIRNNEAWKI